MSEQIHQAWPHSTYGVLTGAAHVSNIEQAAAFNDALAKFLLHPDAGFNRPARQLG
jgi:pimeloyl-ACP methyl ester carboxylesterase